jgi:hypothetical protein
MARHDLVMGGIAAAAARTLLVGRADANFINERLIHDGCEVGGGGNDIQAIQGHYGPDQDRIVVTLRLCGKAKPKATYRVHLDHAAPFVGRVRAQAGCVPMARHGGRADADRASRGRHEPDRRKSDPLRGAARQAACRQAQEPAPDRLVGNQQPG